MHVVVMPARPILHGVETTLLDQFRGAVGLSTLEPARMCR